ncbi:MAG: prolyl oligopeptidase family serine peptidase [Steroidobacteraceae bacterium]
MLHFQPAHKLVVPLCIACLALALGGCNSHDDDDHNNTGGAQSSLRGQLVQSPPTRVASFAAADLIAALGVNAESIRFAQLTGTPLCRVDVHQLQYHTVGGKGEDTTASGALMVPAGTASECRGERPVLLYAHGTTAERNFNLANVTTDDNGESFALLTVFAARGYIVIAPNYAGYDTSSLPYHPYLNAEQSADDMMDALTAARSALPTSFAPDTRAGAKLFITGYSQGGHVAMATHRALQAQNVTVTASAPSSGPYALAAFADAVFYGNVSLSAPVFATLLVNSYQQSYGNVYSATTDVFESRYASGIDTLLPSDVSRSELVKQGRLPALQLFSEVPPAPAFAAITPPTTPPERAPLFALGFGPDHLVTNAYRQSYLADAQAHPDGAFPAVTDGLPAANPQQPLRIDLQRNDLRNWTPTAPVLLCGGNADPTVFYMNTQLMQSYWSTTSAPVTVLDVDSAPANGDAFGGVKDAFSTAKTIVAADAVASGATDGGASEVLTRYHGLVSPFCFIAARSFFDGF